MYRVIYCPIGISVSFHVVMSVQYRDTLVMLKILAYASPWNDAQIYFPQNLHPGAHLPTLVLSPITAAELTVPETTPTGATASATAMTPATGRQG